MIEFLYIVRFPPSFSLLCLSNFTRSVILCGESMDVLQLHPFHKYTSLVRPLHLCSVYNDAPCFGTR